MQLENKVAIVTGTAQGIGFGVAGRFSHEGAKVILADIDEQQGTISAAKLENAAFVSCDVGDGIQNRALAQETVDRYGRVDVCVNNAGILRTGDVLDISEQDFDEVLRVNLRGAFLLRQAAAKQMIQQGGGRIINMSSVNAIMTIPKILPYNVSKGVESADTGNGRCPCR